MVNQRKLGFFEIDSLGLNFQAFETGRFYVVLTLTTDGRFSRVSEYVTAKHTKYYILAVYNEFELDLIVVLDGASYFSATDVTELTKHDGLENVRLQVYRPDINLVEECWR